MDVPSVRRAILTCPLPLSFSSSLFDPTRPDPIWLSNAFALLRPFLRLVLPPDSTLAAAPSLQKRTNTPSKTTKCSIPVIQVTVRAPP